MKLTDQFLRFAVVGTIGFIADASALQLLIKVIGMGLFSGRLVSFLFAATVTWILNRTYTFRAGNTGKRTGEWVRYVFVNGIGGVINYGVYAACILSFSVAREYPVLGVAVGSLVAMMFNFFANRHLVFRPVRQAG